MAVDSSQGTDSRLYELPTIVSNTDVNPGTNILLTGPPMTGKRDIGLKILSVGHNQGEGSIVVTTSDSAGPIIEEYAQLTQSTDDQALGIVDCVSQQHGDGRRRDDDRIKYVQSPADMAGIGLQFSEFLEEFCVDRGLTYNRVMLTSISPLLMYFDLQTVFRFLHVFTRRIDNANALGVFVVDSTAHDDQKLNTLCQLFDALLTVEKPSDSTQSSLHLQRV